MSNQNIIRAWKDRQFRDGLSAAELDLLPEHPAGLIELTELQIAEAVGGRIPPTVTPASCQQDSYSGIIYCC